MENPPYGPPAGFRTGSISRKPVGSTSQSRLQSQSNNPCKAPPSESAKSTNPFAGATANAFAANNSAATSAGNPFAAPTSGLAQPTWPFTPASDPSSPLSRSSSATTNPFTPSTNPSTPGSPFAAPVLTNSFAPAPATSNSTTGHGQSESTLPVRPPRPPSSSYGPPGFDAARPGSTAFLASIGSQQPAFTEPNGIPPQRPGSLGAAAGADLEMQRLIAGFAAKQQSDGSQIPPKPPRPSGGVGDEAGARSTAYGPMPGMAEKRFSTNSNPQPSTQRPMPNATPNQSFSNNNNTTTNQGPAQGLNAGPMPDFDQAEFNTNPQYRDYISARLSGQHTGTFAEYVLETAPAQHKGASLPYMRNNVIYYGDGAASINSANMLSTNIMNSRIMAHNRALKGPPLGEILTYPLRLAGQAVYKQALSDLGMSRSEFETILATVESIRTSTKKEVDKRGLALKAALSVATLGAMLPTLVFMGVHKKSEHASVPVTEYFKRLNQDLRSRGVPVVWQCRLSVIIGLGYDIVVLHSPLE